MVEKLNKIITPIDKNYENLPLKDQQEIYRLFYDKEIAKDLKKSKVYFELGLLNTFGFVSFRGYPHKFEITQKGLNSIGE